MTASALQQLLDEANRLSKNPSQVVRDRGMAVLRRAERFLASGQPFDIELTCACCTRPGRAWFATGVADDYMHPLCCWSCASEWRKAHQGARVLKRNGDEWVERPATARRSA